MIWPEIEGMGTVDVQMELQMRAGATTKDDGEDRSCHSIVFEVEGSFFALPLAAIAKIIARSSPLVRSVDRSDFLYLGEQLVTVLDMGRLMARRSTVRAGAKPVLPNDPGHAPVNAQRRSPQTPPFLIIAQTQPRVICAIPVNKPPNLMELDLSTLRTLPAHTAQAIGHIASHVAVLPGAPTKTTPIFLLNLQQALARLKR
jgi:hypothetical protein